jgi:cytochrome c oxidase subunit III
VRHVVVADVSDLPTHGFGPRTPTWWGTLAFIVIEGTGFALALATYLYLRVLAQEWPLEAPPPNHWPATLLTIVLVLSVVPNHFAAQSAKQQDLRKVRISLIVMSVVGVLPLIIRIFEFPALQVSWDSNAYGSIVWTLLGLHTVHLLTDVVDTLVLAVLMFTRHAKNPRRFGDVDDNAFYWNFVVASWLPIYFVVYWLPRL